MAVLYSALVTVLWIDIGYIVQFGCWELNWWLYVVVFSFTLTL